MIDKIIGFTISKDKIDHQFDFFQRDLNSISFTQNGFHFLFWGIGDLKKSKVNNKLTLSFPKTESLDKRNILINVLEDQIIIENDWLSSIPVFYNKRDKIVSTLYNVCLKSKEINKVGINNFFAVGYSIFGETPFKNVNFLRHNSKIVIGEKEITIKHKQDNFEKLSFNSTVEEVNNLISKKLKSNLSNYNIILPLSGGYDSKYLAYHIDKKEKISSYTYGLTSNPNNSFETVLAKKVAKKLGFKNTIISLGNFSNQIEKWHNLFGSSTHLHGMYQIDFYQKIVDIEKNLNDTVLLSGIIGDAWAGSINFKKINNNLDALFYSHGMKIQNFNVVEGDHFFYQNKNNKKLQIIEIIRAKMILLSYLLTIPEYLGIPSYSPFLEKDIALKTLNLPEKSRVNRSWQKSFFIKNKLEFKTTILKKRNLLNLNSILNENYIRIENDLSSFISKRYLNQIDQVLIKKKFNQIDVFFSQLFVTPYMGYLLRKLKLKPKLFNSYFNYLILKSIDKNLK